MAYTLSQIEQALRGSWGADTTCLDTKSLMRWHQGNPAHGQCGPTALVVQDFLGGELLIAEVTGGDKEDEVHYWNRFVGGIDIDLTREQFGPHRILGDPRVVVRPPEGPRAYATEYARLKARVLSALK